MRKPDGASDMDIWTDVVISFPGAESSNPSLNIACGEKPVVLCDEEAKDAPRNFVVD